MSRIIQDVVALLNRLIQLDYDAAEAWKTALASLGNAKEAEALAGPLGDHRRHIEELAIVVRNLGGEPSAYGDLRQVLTRGRVVLGGLTGDRAILEAIRTSEEWARAEYDDAASQPGVPVDVLAVLERHLCDEREHLAKIGLRLEAMHATSPLGS